MKKFLIVFLLSMCYSFCFSQLVGDMSAYYPNGTKINFKFSCINDIIDSIGFKETSSSSTKYAVVYFKKLTNKPLFIFFLDKPLPSKINEAIKAYNYSKYLNSYTYYHDLKEMIKSGSLTKDYLLDVFQNPDEKGTEENNSEFWIFKSFNLKITFDGDIPNSAAVINYNAIIQNELAVPSFQVTGGDYSIGFNISLSNYGKKTIKYIFITVTATNPVNDKVGTKTVKAVGPIKPTETGTYEFDDILYSRVVKYLEIDNIRLQYMDGSFKTIPKSQISAIQITDWEEYGNRRE